MSCINKREVNKSPINPYVIFLSTQNCYEHWTETQSNWETQKNLLIFRCIVSTSLHTIGTDTHTQFHSHLMKYFVYVLWIFECHHHHQHHPIQQQPEKDLQIRFGCKIIYACCCSLFFWVLYKIHNFLSTKTIA